MSAYLKHIDVERLLYKVSAPRFMRFFHVAISIVAVLLFVMTFVVFLQSDVLDKRSRLFNLVLYADIAVFSIVFTILVRQLVLLFMKRRKNLAGSRLHSRIVFIMGIISVTPPIVVAAMLWFVFNESIQTWFSNRVSTALSQSTAVAEGYFEEHKNVIRYSAEALALDLAADWENLRKNPEVLQNVLNAQASLRSLNEAIIFNPESVVLARSYLTLSLDLFWVTKEDIHKAKDEVVLFTKDRTDRVRAMVRIHPDDNFYLLVGRYVDSTILSRIQEVHDAKSEYSNFQNRVGQIQITFTIIFGTLTVAVLLLSVWVGLGFAGQIVGPISAVIQGAERAGSGDLNARLSVVTTEPDIQLLANTFNAMLSSLQSQRKELLDSQALSDKRRRLIQAVLKSISTGVVTLDAQNHTTMINPRAREILNMREKESEGVKLDDCIPDVSVLLKQARVQGYIQRQISPIINGELHQLLVSVSKIAGRKGHDDLVMTLDDITLLVHAQKQEAWSDVARRIAHEIKNPLTPIQLSAERIKRRYPPQDPDEKEIFDRCINTIVRQVDHIGRLVSEFSSYAKMPQPQYQLVQTIALLKDIVLFNTEDVHANSTLSFETVNEAGTVISEKTAAHITGLWQCDPDQISQVLRNLIKNAQESVTENSPHNGNILLRACVSHDGLTIEVHDNGRGFPVGPIERLLDPYVTHKEKGTGLGLAIVHKIVVDHEGKLTLLPSALLGGACVRITIPKHMFRTTTEV